jgi:hypothetical protein
LDEWPVRKQSRRRGSSKDFTIKDFDDYHF